MKIYFLTFIALFLMACGDSDLSDESISDSKLAEPITEGSWYKPVLGSSWQWQLNGVINTTYDVDLYDVDLFDTNRSVIDSLHSEGKKVICYFSAGSYEDWREDSSDFPQNILGRNMDGWEGEKWLDISSDELFSVMRARLDLAVEKNCDGVEPDNMDGYVNNTGFVLNSTEQLAYNIFIANEAHIRDLSVGLKNDVDQIVELEPYFDFAVNEECHLFGECEAMQPFIDVSKPVFHVEYDIEYVNNVDNVKDKMCEDSIALEFQTLILPMDLDDSFRYSCR